MITCASGESRISFSKRSYERPEIDRLSLGHHGAVLQHCHRKVAGLCLQLLRGAFGKVDAYAGPAACACSTTMLLPTMKMISSTRKISVSGVMLMSLKTEGRELLVVMVVRSARAGDRHLGVPLRHGGRGLRLGLWRGAGGPGAAAESSAA